MIISNSTVRATFAVSLNDNGEVVPHFAAPTIRKLGRVVVVSFFSNVEFSMTPLYALSLQKTS